MKYEVRTAEGTLTFDSFGELERFYLMGMIGPEDEVREEGSKLWRKAGALPQLAQAKRQGDEVWRGTWMVWTLLGVIGGSIALYLLRSKEVTMQAMGAILALVTAVALIQLNLKVSKRRRPGA